jgi:hypothetical protein
MKRRHWAALGSALVISILAAAPAGPAFAQTQGGGGGGGTAATPGAAASDAQRFEQGKARVLKFMDARIQAMQKAQSCVQAASNRDQLRACRRQERESMHSHHGPGAGAGEGRRGPGAGPGGPEGRGPGPGPGPR